MNRYPIPALSVAALSLAALLAAPAKAQSVAEFYKGRTIDLVVGSGAGGGYDDYARLLARHMGRHIPGTPTIVVRNLVGAGGRQAMNYVYSIMPKDGSGFGSTLKNIPFDPLYGIDATKIDADKVGWIGSLNSEVSLCIVWHKKGVKTIEEARAKEVKVGSSGPSTTDTMAARILNRLAGTRFNVIQGYPSSTQVHIAMEREEVDGRCGMGYDSLQSRFQHWTRENKVDILAQFALKKHPELPKVPFVLELAKTQADRQIAELLLAPNEMGRPFFAPPGLPPERLQALRRAFDASSKDPELLAEAKKQNVTIDLLTGEDMEALIKRVYQTPKDIVAQAKVMVEGK